MNQGGGATKIQDGYQNQRWLPKSKMATKIQDGYQNPRWLLKNSQACDILIPQTSSLHSNQFTIPSHPIFLLCCKKLKFSIKDILYLSNILQHQQNSLICTKCKCKVFSIYSSSLLARVKWKKEFSKLCDLLLSLSSSRQIFFFKRRLIEAKCHLDILNVQQCKTSLFDITHNPCPVTQSKHM